MAPRQTNGKDDAGNTTDAKFAKDSEVTNGFEIFEGAVEAPKRGRLGDVVEIWPSIESVYNQLLAANGTNDSHHVGNNKAVVNSPSPKEMNTNGPTMVGGALFLTNKQIVQQLQGSISKLNKRNPQGAFVETTITVAADSPARRDASADAGDGIVKLEFSIRYRTAEEQALYLRKQADRKARKQAEAAANGQQVMASA